MSTNQRSSYRCATPDPGAKAVFRVGRRKIVAELLDQSAGGFSIRYRGRPRVRIGHTAKLRTHAGWSEVTVVHVERIGGDTRLGLQRERELLDPRDERMLVRPSVPPLFGTSGIRLSSPAVVLMVILIAAVWGSAIQPRWLTSLARWVRTQSWQSPASIQSVEPIIESTK